MENLASYLIERLPGGMAYPDARQLCLRFYCTADGVPDFLRPQLSRDGLAETFGELARSGWIREASVESMRSNHWVEVIDSIFKQGANFVNIQRGEVLVREMGFGQESV